MIYNEHLEKSTVFSYIISSDPNDDDPSEVETSPNGTGTSETDEEIKGDKKELVTC